MANTARNAYRSETVTQNVQPDYPGQTCIFKDRRQETGCERTVGVQTGKMLLCDLNNLYSRLEKYPIKSENIKFLAVDVTVVLKVETLNFFITKLITVEQQRWKRVASTR